MQATTAYERECEALEGLKQALQATRKAVACQMVSRALQVMSPVLDAASVSLQELAAESKQRDIVQQADVASQVSCR